MKKIELYRSFCDIVGKDNSVQNPSKFVGRCCICNVEQFERVNEICLQYFRDLYGDDVDVVYRGQKYESWRITPSISRIRNMYKNEKAFLDEYRKCKKVKNQLSLDDIFTAQHYGFPSRLIDITKNPKVALWFASDSFKKNTGKEHNGEVVVLPVKIVSQDAPFALFNIWQINNFERIKTLEKKKIIKLFEDDTGIQADFYDKYDEEFIVPFRVFKAEKECDRSRNQEALGLLAPLKTVKTKDDGHRCLIYRYFPKKAISIKISGPYKFAIRKDLDSNHIGINEKFLFPNDMEHLSHYIVNKYMQKE